jgi:hypothetical protein
MAAFRGPRLVTDGLVLCLDAANSKSYPGSGTIWKDLSGEGNDGSLNDGAAFDSSTESISFDGINDGVEIGSPLLATPDEFTVIIWFKPIGTKSGVQMLIYEGAGGDGFGGQNEFHVHYVNNGSIAAWMTGGISFSSASGLVPTNAFSQAAYVVRGLSTTATANLYLNSVSVGSGSGTITRSGYGNTLIGRPASLAFPTPPRTYEGNIAQVAIYDRELTAQEIQQNFNATRGRFGL